jgi:hypothetical protein
MAHHNFNDQTQHGRLLRRYLNGIETVIDEGPDVLAVLDQMLTGSAASEASFSVITLRFGFADNANAKLAYDEISSANAKTSGDSEVTSVNAALRQIIAKLR